MDNHPPARAEPETTFPVHAAFSREYRAIWGRDDTFATKGDYLARVLSDRTPQAALCLSGGGIRSAAFGLGVLQSLARHRLLAPFHYLSTVSGGGYIGCWLQAWLLAEARAADPAGRITHATVERVEAILGNEMEPPPLDALRGFTSYLAPRMGLASPDTWTGIVLVLRNILVNWAVFGPALFALALLPLAYQHLLRGAAAVLSPLLLTLATAALAFAVRTSCLDLPSHVGRDGQFARPGAIKFGSVWPAVAWAVLLPLAVAPALNLWRGAGFAGRPFGGHPGWVVTGAAFAALSVGYAAAWIEAARRHRAADLFLKNLFAWIVASAVACALLAAGIGLAVAGDADLLLWRWHVGKDALLAAFGPVWAMLAHLCLNAVFVALRGEAARGELDREWLARLSGMKILPLLIWAVFAAVCTIGPLAAQANGAFSVSLSSAGTFAAGLVARFLGKSSKTPAIGVIGSLSLSQLALAATAIFAVGLFALLSLGGQALLTAVCGDQREARLGFVALGLSLGIGGLDWWWLGRVVNINRFSLHNIYRNRLLRAFLGSGRQLRTQELTDFPLMAGRGRKGYAPDPFTGFDPRDNPRLHELAPAAGATRRLFPVIGTALNLVSGAPQAWAERKAAPFSMTPVACGSESLPSSAGNGGGCFVNPKVFGGKEKETGEDDTATGISLGTAMAVSGAAVSPNMGYHSSPATAFLLTLFNVRLGVWLPNPSRVAGADLLAAKPPNSLRGLADEMLGRTGYKGPAIYLSDGGHFDNLGLYEMVQRGCRLIMVVDAGQDGAFEYHDLADAIRKIRIDQRVEIEFTMPLPMVPRAEWTAGRHRPFALAKLRWPPPTCAEGWLLYIKPCLFEAVPVDLQAYAKQDPAFPNDTTADQFFTESQFESYRKLGLFIADMLHDFEMTDRDTRGFLRDLAAARHSSA